MLNLFPKIRLGMLINKKKHVSVNDFIEKCVVISRKIIKLEYNTNNAMKSFCRLP